METNPLTPEQMAAFAAMMQGQQAAPAANQQPTQYQQPVATPQAEEPATAAAPPAAPTAASEIAAIVARAKAAAAAAAKQGNSAEKLSQEAEDFFASAIRKSSRVAYIEYHPEQPRDAQGNVIRSSEWPEFVVLEDKTSFRLRSGQSDYGAHEYLNVLEVGMLVSYGKSKHVDYNVIYDVE